MQRVPVKNRTGCTEIMQVALAMHADFKQRGESGAIIKALRAAHFLDFLPGEHGLQPVSPEEDALYPAGGHRVDPIWSAPKTEWMQPVEGRPAFQPLPCDWSALNQLRQRLEGQKPDQVPDSEPLP